MASDVDEMNGPDRSCGHKYMCGDISHLPGMKRQYGGEVRKHFS
jgi:hypothetical protein